MSKALSVALLGLLGVVGAYEIPEGGLHITGKLAEAVGEAGRKHVNGSELTSLDEAREEVVMMRRLIRELLSTTTAATTPSDGPGGGEEGEEVSDEVGMVESCGSCYGAADGCCDTCEEVKKAYEQRGWGFEPEGVAQCSRGDGAVCRYVRPCWPPHSPSRPHFCRAV